MSGFNSTGMESCCCANCFKMLERYDQDVKASTIYCLAGGPWIAPKRIPIFQCTCNRLIELDENESYRLVEK